MAQVTQSELFLQFFIIFPQFFHNLLELYQDTFIWDPLVACIFCCGCAATAFVHAVLHHNIYLCGWIFWHWHLSFLTWHSGYYTCNMELEIAPISPDPTSNPPNKTPGIDFIGIYNPSTCSGEISLKFQFSRQILTSNIFVNFCHNLERKNVIGKDRTGALFLNTCRHYELCRQILTLRLGSSCHLYKTDTFSHLQTANPTTYSTPFTVQVQYILFFSDYFIRFFQVGLRHVYACMHIFIAALPQLYFVTQIYFCGSAAKTKADALWNNSADVWYILLRQSRTKAHLCGSLYFLKYFFWFFLNFFWFYLGYCWS